MNRKNNDTKFHILFNLFLDFFPGDFATRVKQINSQSVFIWVWSFAGLSYLTHDQILCPEQF